MNGGDAGIMTTELSGKKVLRIWRVISRYDRKGYAKGYSTFQ